MPPPGYCYFYECPELQDLRYPRERRFTQLLEGEAKEISHPSSRSFNTVVLTNICTLGEVYYQLFSTPTVVYNLTKMLDNYILLTNPNFNIFLL